MIEKINHKIPDFLLKPNFRIFRHFFIQIVVLLITVNILWDEPDEILYIRLGAWFIYFLQINIVIYGNMYLLVPHLLINGKILYYILSLLFLVLFAVFTMGLLQEIFSPDASESTPMLLESIASLAAFIVFIIGLTTIHLFKYRLGNIRKISELENATMAIELSNLQNQINPHFLFNTINNANILAGEDAEKSSYILKKLNDLLRYQTDGETKGAVNLTDDIAFLKDYLNLEKTRRDRFSYTIKEEGNCSVTLPPLLFIPFVENAVKHNPENDAYINIVFRITGNTLYFECENPKARLIYSRKDGGIGLVNIRKRLDLLFGNDYTLQLQDQKEKYTVIMKFKI